MRCVSSILYLLLAIALAGCNKSLPIVRVDLREQIELLKGDTESKLNALTKIASVGVEAEIVVKEMLPLLKDADPSVRKLAAYAIGQVGYPAKDAIPALKRLMQDPDPEVAAAAIASIREIDPSQAPGMSAQRIYP